MLKRISTPNSRFIRYLFIVCLILSGISLSPLKLVTAQSSQTKSPDSSAELIEVDVDLPSDSTGSPTGTLSLHIQSPSLGRARYLEGAPVIIWVPGGFDLKPPFHQLPPSADDIIILTFVFPGGDFPKTNHHSDGSYDYRGSRCIEALGDIIKYAAGELTDNQDRTIDDVLPVNVLHDNIGMIGVSNGGNIIVAVPALLGEELSGRLRYLIQWETPVSSQVATRDFGRVWLKPSPQQGEYFNPRYSGYHPLVFPVNYSDLAYDPSLPFYQIFHDGNGDGLYNTTKMTGRDHQTPDHNQDGILGLDEDFPLDSYPSTTKNVYSRPVTHALANNNIFSGSWPDDIANPAEADAFWNIREAVWLYDDASRNIPDVEGMILAGVRDHVQSAPDKPHIRQAFEGWFNNGAWVQINPSSDYIIEADPTLSDRNDLPDNVPNTQPADWSDVSDYAIPEDIDAATYQLAAVWQMADRVQNKLDTTEIKVQTPQTDQGVEDRETPPGCLPGLFALVSLCFGLVTIRQNRLEEDQ